MSSVLDGTDEAGSTAPPAGTEAAGSRERPLSAERMIFFSDAVVAIAMTLLALELPVPSGHRNDEVLRQLREGGEEYIAFLISFAVVGVQWFSHHRLFEYVARLGGGLLR